METIQLLKYQPMIDLEFSTPARCILKLPPFLVGNIIRECPSRSQAFRPAQFASIMAANSTANNSDSVVFKHSFSLMEESREGFGTGYFSLIAVTPENTIPV